MRRNILPLLCLLAGLIMQSCNKQKTYAEMLEAERKTIERYITLNDINQITYNQFIANDSTTNVDRNEYVLFSDNGVYMQIVNEGEGKKAEDGDQIIVRCIEVFIETGDTTVNSGMNPSIVDEFKYEKSSTVARGTFLAEDGQVFGPMYNFYYNLTGSGIAVPNGWLVPLDYIKLTRNTSKLAKVRIIVPSKMGTTYSVNNVYPTYYELTYQLSR